MSKNNFDLSNEVSHMFDQAKSMDFSALLNEWIIPYGTKLLLAIIIFYVGRFVAKSLSRLLARSVFLSTKDEMLKSFVQSISYFLLLLIVIIAALSQLGINTTSLVALIGAAGLAIGLALQNSLQNFAAGVMILIFKPFKKGDWIEAGGVAGRVEQMGILVLELRTADNKTILAPNGKVFADNIVNYSRNETRRIDMIFDIAYEADIAKAKAIVARCLADNSHVLPEPEPLIAVGSLGESSVQIFVRPWVQTPNFMKTQMALLESIKLAFDAENIEIPFNKLDVNLSGVLPHAERPQA